MVLEATEAHKNQNSANLKNFSPPSKIFIVFFADRP